MISRLLLVAIVAGCSSSPKNVDRPGAPRLVRRFVAPAGAGIDGCLFASPLSITTNGQPAVLTASSAGALAAIDPSTGAVLASLQLPAPDGQEPYLLATPVVIGQRAVIAYMLRDAASKLRLSHLVAVIDLDRFALDPSFAPLALSAQQNGVTFNDATQASRSALLHVLPPGMTLGRVYVSFGNIQDIQPWHGWVFEIDLDQWKVSGVLVTTSDSDCGPAGMSGAREMVCGGGVWAPAGPQLLSDGDSYDVLVPAGNGAFDLTRGDYANTILRAKPGLTFATGCDATLCAGLDIDAPAESCLSSCGDLFVPRVLAGQPLPSPESGACDGKSLFQCYATLDWDLGADSPSEAHLGTQRLLVLPSKEGAIYLFDADHLGTLYDRLPVVTPCGTPSDKCQADWAGMMVTRPVMAQLDGADVAIIPTFVFDHTHPAGVVAVRVSDGPRLEKLWEAPSFASDEARAQFRRHPSRATLVRSGADDYAFVVDVQGAAGKGLLYGIAVRDGAIVERMPLGGGGQRYVEPLVIGDGLFVPSCNSDDGPSQLEAFTLTSE